MKVVFLVFLFVTTLTAGVFAAQEQYFFDEISNRKNNAIQIAETWLYEERGLSAEQVVVEASFRYPRWFVVFKDFYDEQEILGQVNVDFYTGETTYVPLFEQVPLFEFILNESVISVVDNTHFLAIANSHLLSNEHEYVPSVTLHIESAAKIIGAIALEEAAFLDALRLEMIFLSRHLLEQWFWSAFVFEIDGTNALMHIVIDGADGSLINVTKGPFTG
ncbi:MAG: hypothetical protein FWG63_13005 [Defluviitaleaceae bacterium]|nr:hypothetical protein [Defluviitaleaceae bacterium]